LVKLSEIPWERFNYLYKKYTHEVGKENSSWIFHSYWDAIKSLPSDIVNFCSS